MNHYYTYCKDLISVKTSINNFKWVFGRNAPDIGQDAFDQSLIKLSVATDNDNNITAQCDMSMRRFGDYYGRIGDNQIIFSKHIKVLGTLSYKISRNGNSLNVVIGKRYLRFIKYKIMHLHPMYYILFDFVTAILLENGYLPLYCSAVSFSTGNTSVMVAPPNTGKSLTRLLLINRYDAALIAEDIAVTDGEYVWPVPYTFTYRDYGSIKLKKDFKVCADKKKIDNLFWLQHGEPSLVPMHIDEADKLQVLNDYLAEYAKSPAIDAFYYFNNCFKSTELLQREKNLLLKLLNNVKAYHVFNNDAQQYAKEVKNNLNR